MRGDSGVAGEGRVVGVPKFHSWGKCTMPLTNINSDLFNASSGLCIILVILYYTGPLSCILWYNVMWCNVSWGVTYILHYMYRKLPKIRPPFLHTIYFEAKVGRGRFLEYAISLVHTPPTPHGSLWFYA